jgi:hypothetical protein
MAIDQKTFRATFACSRSHRELGMRNIFDHSMIHVTLYKHKKIGI